MSRLVIVGARAMGREVCAYAQDLGVTVKGFLDQDPDVLGEFRGYPPILSSVEEYVVSADDVFIVALGDPKYRRQYANMIREKGGRFISIIHPTAYVGKNVNIGEGCIVCPGAIITNDSTLGEHVIVNVNVSINHDNCIGNFATISPGCSLAGRVSIGDGVFIGVGASIIPDVVIGEQVIIAAGAVVTKSFEQGLIMGVPAKEK